eukprot:879500-Rhodomonas_salina.3
MHNLARALTARRRGTQHARCCGWSVTECEEEQEVQVALEGWTAGGSEGVKEEGEADVNKWKAQVCCCLWAQSCCLWMPCCCLWTLGCEYGGSASLCVWRQSCCLWRQCCCLWRQLAFYGGSVAVYGGSVAVYGGRAAVYGGSAALFEAMLPLTEAMPDVDAGGGQALFVSLQQLVRMYQVSQLCVRPPKSNLGFGANCAEITIHVRDFVNCAEITIHVRDFEGVGEVFRVDVLTWSSLVVPASVGAYTGGHVFQSEFEPPFVVLYGRLRCWCDGRVHRTMWEGNSRLVWDARRTKRG